MIEMIETILWNILWLVFAIWTTIFFFAIRRVYRWSIKMILGSIIAILIFVFFKERIEDGKYIKTTKEIHK